MDSNDILYMVLKIILFASFLLVAIQDVEACQCAKLKKLRRIDVVSAEYIFIGRVILIDSVDISVRKVVFEVIRQLKNNDKQIVEVFTGYGFGDCGLPVQIGQEWYIFSEGRKSQASVSMCGRSFLMNISPTIVGDYNKYDRKIINKLGDDIKRVARDIHYVEKIFSSKKQRVKVLGG